MAAKIFMDMPGGLKMPALGLGTWQSTDEAQLENALNVALEIGYRHIDTAFVYGNEKIIGKVLNQWISSGKLKREDLFITTKLPFTGIHRDRVESFMKKSLENLQLDYVDLYLIHFPIGIQYTEGQPLSDPIVPEKSDHIAIWKKMEEQVDAGRTKTIGLSNFHIKQIENISKTARIKPACLQVEIHVFLQQRALVNYCHQNNIVVVAYCPLGNPSYNQFLGSIGLKEREIPSLLENPVVKAIGEKHSKSSAQVLLRYLLQKNIVPIPKSVTPSRLKENIDVFDFNLSTDEMKKLDDLEAGEAGRVCDFNTFPQTFLDHPDWPIAK